MLPPGAGLWLRDDLLAPPARLAGGRRLGRACTTRCSIGSAKPTRSTGAGPVWTVPASRPKGGRRRRSEPDGSRQTGHEAPCCGRPRRHPARQPPDRGQPPRLGRLRGRCSMPSRRSSSRTAAAQAPRQAACRQGLRHPALPPGALPSATSGSASPAKASTPASGWAAIAGWSSAPWPGSTSSGA